jgi:putative FmdB family regulatory protein
LPNHTALVTIPFGFRDITKIILTRSSVFGEKLKLSHRTVLCEVRMPIYTYRCRKCDHTFERNQRMTDAPLSDCPACDGAVRRVINSVGVVFKGSGFYVTDNRNGNGKANGSVSKNGAGTSGNETKTADAAKESKPAAPAKAVARESTSASATAAA